ncbi:GPP34 family phosphoprotein [Embleya sp. NPDC050493]|uniref:GOLPH3/VPS74 family protein n=1 Tax=Embleya sp. NPDC050493 TaxID=3363989 RepID=UPI0037970957
MTTARDLMITAMDAAPDGTVRQGDLSLALAGAELVDLLAAETVTLDGDLIVPGIPIALDDPLLNEAVSMLSREGPPESVEDWLWRRGRNLAATYAATLASEGQLSRRRRRWAPFSTGRVVVSDSADHRHAKDRSADHEPVLTALAAAGAGIPGNDEGAQSAPSEGPVATVLTAVEDAVTELAAVRQRRTIEQDAFDNTWRAP